MGYLLKIMLLVSSIFTFIHLLTIKIAPVPFKNRYVRDSPYLGPIDLYVPTINLCLSVDNPQCLNLALDLTISTLIIESSVNQAPLFKNQFNSSLSSSFVTLTSFTSTRTVNFYTTYAIRAREIITLPNKRGDTSYNDTIPLILIDNIKEIPLQEPIDGFIGLLSYYSLPITTPKGFDYSFVNYLFNTSQIKRRSFMFQYKSDLQNSSISFGESYDNYKRCNKAVTSFEGSAGCSLEEIRIGQAVISNQTEDLQFNTVSSLIRASTNSGLVLFAHIIKAAQGKCKEMEEKDLIILLCDKDVDVIAFPDIQLKMQEVTLVIKWKNVFRFNEKQGQYVSFLTYYTNNRNYWSLGLPGLTDNSLVFDYDNRSIGFLEEEVKDVLTPQTPFMTKGMLSFCMLVLLAGLVLLFKIKMK